MHELTIARNIVEIVQDEVSKMNYQDVTSVDISIGELCGIEKDMFLAVWPAACGSGALRKAQCHITEIEGQAHCEDCGRDFSLHTITQTCPHCHGHHRKIKKGRELQIKSITITQ